MREGVVSVPSKGNHNPAMVAPSRPVKYRPSDGIDAPVIAVCSGFGVIVKTHIVQRPCAAFTKAITQPLKVRRQLLPRGGISSHAQLPLARAALGQSKRQRGGLGATQWHLYAQRLRYTPSAPQHGSGHGIRQSTGI
jgi:hypothetical protein